MVGEINQTFDENSLKAENPFVCLHDIYHKDIMGINPVIYHKDRSIAENRKSVFDYVKQYLYIELSDTQLSMLCDHNYDSLDFIKTFKEIIGR